MEKWKNYRLGDICDVSSSKRIYSSEYCKSGVPFYRGKEIIEKHFNNAVSTELYISRSRYNEIKRKFAVPQISDILLTSVGTLGIPWLVDETEFYFKDGNLTWLKAKQNKISSKFLYLWLNSPQAQHQIDMMSIGSTQKALTIETLNKFCIFLPSLEIQEKVCSVFYSVLDKIKVNRQINTNLEQQAQAIFKSWFIDFEPFGGTMPDDWSISTLNQISKLNAGGDKPLKISNIKTKQYLYPVYSNGLANDGLYGYTDNAKIFNESVTVSARGTIGSICLRHTPFVPIVRLISIIPNSFITAKYLYCWLKHSHITGTGTTQQQLTIPDFGKKEIIVPPIDLMYYFTETVEPLFNSIWLTQDEIYTLTALRDTLLPKLMSGEIDVSKIELD